MNSEVRCASCGQMLPRDSRAGVCPVCEFAGALAAPSAAVRPETPMAAGTVRLGDYELLQEIAHGGMGVVYRARQLTLNRMVAVKLIHPRERSSDHFVQRFRTEAEAAAKLQHANIIAIHEIGEDDGCHFFSMEYVEGPNLQEMAREKPLTPPQAARYVQVVAEAIHYAHQQGVLHRDLKPSNVLIAASDTPKITDFGLAKVLTGDTDLTLSGQVLGTPHYLPPEQASGKRGQVGPWSDVYGLGAILYYLLTSRPPFQAQEITEVLSQVLHRDPVSPRLLNPSVPRDLETICLKCLEKEPARRYATAASVAEDLRRHLCHETILARPVSSPEKAWRWCRRKPALAAALGACALALVVGVTGISWQWRRAEAEGQVARRSLYDSDMLLAYQAFEENNYGRVEQLLLKHHPQSPGRQHAPWPGWEWRYLWGQIQSEENFTLGDHSNTVTYVAFSPDGRWLVSASHRYHGNDVKVWDLPQRRLVCTLPRQERVPYINACAFSPDSQSLAVAGYRSLDFYRAPRWSQAVPDLSISNRFLSVMYSPDGRLLFGFENDPHPLVRIRDAHTFEIFRSWPAIAGYVAVLSPDARYAAVMSALDDPRAVIVQDMATGEEVAQLPGPGAGYRQGNILFSPDGRMFACVVGQGDETTEKCVDFWSVPDFKLLQRLQSAHVRYSSVIFSPDSRYAYVAGSDQTITLFEVATWTPIRTLHGHRDEVWCLAISADGQWLASGSRDQTLRVWSTAPGPKPPTHWPTPPGTREFYLADDGLTLATVTTNHTVQIWATTNFQLQAEFPDPFQDRIPWSNRQWTQVALSQGGHLLAMSGWTSLSSEIQEKTVTWHIPAMQMAAQYRGLPSAAAGLALSPDGKLLVATGGFDANQALIWEVASGRLLHTLTNVVRRSGLVKFSASKSRLAIRLDDDWTYGLKVGLWTLPRTEPERILTRHRHRVVDLAFSPDERLLATAGQDATVCLWDVATGERLHDLAGQLVEFISIAWSPRGDRLVGGGADGSITIWDTVSWQPVGRLKGHSKPVRCLAFLPDGNCLVSFSVDSLRLWQAPAAAENAAAD